MTGQWRCTCRDRIFHVITLLPASPRDYNPPHSQAEKHLTVKICINNAANWRKTSSAVLLQFLGDQDRPSMVGMDTDGAGSSSSDDSKSTAAFSLVKYENPEIIDIDDEPDEKDGESCEEILNSILPPREWEHNGKLWRQSVFASPATRLDVMNLQEQLDQKLQQRQARETGICQVRRELYSQCFDELIRQSTINCVERGLLMLRVRDELKMTLMAYQTLYESSIAFGIRKALKAEQGKHLFDLFLVH